MLQISIKLFSFYGHRNVDGSWPLEPKQKSDLFILAHKRIKNMSACVAFLLLGFFIHKMSAGSS